MARVGASLFQNQSAVSMSLFGPYLTEIFPQLTPKERYQAIYGYYHHTSKDAKTKNKFIVKDLLTPFLLSKEVMARDVALYNLNIGLSALEAKLTSPEATKWADEFGGSIQARSLEQGGAMLLKFPLSEITDEMLITPMIILFISIAKRGSSATTWINRHGATLNAEHRFSSLI